MQQSSVNILIVARADLASEDIERCLHPSGHGLFALVRSMNAAREAVEGHTASAREPALVVYDVEAAQAAEAAAVAALARQLDVPVVYIARSAEELARAQATGTFGDADIACLLEPRELSLAIRFARHRHGSADLLAHRQAEEQIARLEVALSRRAAELQAANAELESFSYSVSHDLRAPLRALDGFSMVLLEDYAAVLDERGAGYLRRLRRASQRMSRLIDDLLELSRMSRSAMQVEECDLSALAHEILQDMQQSAPERQVEVVIAPGLRGQADRSLLRCALRNLLGNAWKFTSRRARARIELGATTRDGQTAYFVRDNGAGFDMAYADKLFDAFQRLHGMDEFEGTGIGLTTVQRIIRRHGGTIWAEGEVDVGATFTFALP